VPTIKVVSSACNLRCCYCYYHKEDQVKISKINLKTLENIINKTVFFVNGQKIKFVWHGGEPLLAGIDLFKEILRIEKNIGASKKITNCVQTNATLITTKWANFFSENSFSVGISLDGPEYIHDAYRVFKNGDGSHKAVLMGLKNLQNAGIYPAAIGMITKKSLPHAKEIFDFFLDKKIKTFHLKPCYEIDPLTNQLADFSVTPLEYSDFMMDILDIWFKRNDPSICIRNLEQILKAQLGGTPNLCEVSGDCWLFPTVEFDGSVSACDSFPVRKYYFGNINRDSWENLLQSANSQMFLEDFTHNLTRCADCKWISICHGCCLRYAYSLENNTWHHNIFCEAKKRLFNYIETKIKAVKRG